MTAPFVPKLPRVGVSLLREIVAVDGEGRLVTMRAIVGVEQMKRGRLRGPRDYGALGDFPAFFG